MVLKILKPSPTDTLWAISPDGSRWVNFNDIIRTLKIPTLHTPMQIYRLPREEFRSTYPCIATAAIALLEWMTGGLIILLSNLTPVRLEDCNPPIAIISGPKGSSLSTNKVFSNPALLVRANWSAKDHSKDPPQVEAALVVNCWGKCNICAHFFGRMYSFLFACVFVVFFVFVFIRTFVIYTRVSITISIF